MISIEIPIIQGESLNELMDSIYSQSNQDFQVIAVAPPGEVADRISKYDIKLVRCRTGLLDARYLAHLEARGDYELLLDETRILREDALRVISNVVVSPMAVVGEEEAGEGFWVKLAQLDKEMIMEYNTSVVEPAKSFVLPRLYKRELLDNAFINLKINIPTEVFHRIIYEDHHLIFYEAYRTSKAINIIREPLIKHYGDSSLTDIARKYYRYGSTSNLLRRTSYWEFINTTKRKRVVKGVRNTICLFILYSVRGIPFVVGSWFGRG